MVVRSHHDRFHENQTVCYACFPNMLRLALVYVGTWYVANDVLHHEYGACDTQL